MKVKNIPIKLTLEAKIQLILLELEETILCERMPCGFYKRGDWRPNVWSARILRQVESLK